MVSAKKSTLKRVLIIILSVLVAHCAVSMVVTKVVYDSIFERYDPASEPLHRELRALVDQRQEVSYECHGITLAGYLYRCTRDHPRDTLIVLAPGFHAGGDDYLWQIQSLLEKGWSVFTFDPTGSCQSEGASYQGFPQEILDLDATLDYIEENSRFGYRNIALMGHSRGGYAVSCVLGYGHDIAAAISVSGVNSAMDGIMSYSTQHIGPLAYGNYGFLWAYQATIFGTDAVGLQAYEEISQSNVPVLVIQGAEDETFPPDEYSIYAHKEEISRDGVQYLLMDKEGQNGHTNLLFSGFDSANEELMGKISQFLEDSIP